MSELDVEKLRKIWELEAQLEKAKKSRDRFIEKVRDIQEDILNLERQLELSV